MATEKVIDFRGEIKAELIKAYNNDREQYKKGYIAEYNDAINDVIRIMLGVEDEKQQ